MHDAWLRENRACRIQVQHKIFNKNKSKHVETWAKTEQIQARNRTDDNTHENTLDRQQQSPNWADNME